MDRWMTKYSVGILIVSSLVCTSQLVFARPNTETDDNGVPTCSKDGYCQGTVFPAIVRVDGRDIVCDGEVSPRRQCCLPHARHMVCYSIATGGQFFNIDSTDITMTTDFPELCKAMLEYVGKTFKQYSTVAVGTGGGLMTYRHGKVNFLDPQESGQTHIHHLACAYEEDED